VAAMAFFTPSTGENSNNGGTEDWLAVDFISASNRVQSLRLEREQNNRIKHINDREKKKKRKKTFAFLVERELESVPSPSPGNF